MVDKVTEFFLHTLTYSRVRGPFTTSQLQDMFEAAHFCENVASGKLPASYQQTVQYLQQQFPLPAASHQLLLSLGDNIRVNREAMDTARKLHDRQTADLDTWLYCRQRNQVRNQFLMATEAVKGTEEWERLRSYMCLVELANNDDRGLSKLVMDKTDRMLGTLLVQDLQFLRTQQKIIKSLSNILNFDKLQVLDIKVLAKVMTERKEIVKIVVKVVTEVLTLTHDGTLDRIESVAEVLSNIVKLMRNSALTDFLESLERNLICNRFVREEFINSLVVKLGLGTFC